MPTGKWVSITIALLLAAAAGALIMYLQRHNGASAAHMPYSIVMTFRGDTATSMAFTWQTDSPLAQAVLQVAPGGENTPFPAESTIVTYKGTTKGLPVNNGKTAGIHQAEATGLAPDTSYWYRVGTGEEDSWSKPGSFVTGLAGEGDFSFINVTDSQGETAEDFALWGKTLSMAQSLYPNARFIVHNGDLTENPADSKAWDSFFASASNTLIRIPLMPVTGNHDEIDGSAEPFASHFFLPDNGVASLNKGTNYSFDYGPVHFAVLNTESTFNKQADWLRKDLAATKQPWKIVAIHRGIYAGNQYDKVEGWAAIMDEFQVDLVLQGHNHEYSRSYPLRGGKTVGNGEDPVQNRAGTVYVVTNTSGPKFNEKKEDLFYHKVHFQNEKQMFAGISIKRNKLTYQAYDVDRKLLDRFVLEHE